MTSQLTDNKINYMATIQKNADLQLSVNSEDYGYDTIRCNTMHYFNVRSRADTQPTIKKWGERKKTKIKNRYAQKYRSGESGHRVSPEDTDIVLYMLYSYTSNEAKGLSIPVLSFSCR